MKPAHQAAFIAAIDELEPWRRVDVNADLDRARDLLQYARASSVPRVNKTATILSPFCQPGIIESSFLNGIVCAMDTGKTKVQALQSLSVMKRLDALEVSLCQPINDQVRRPLVRGIFAGVSRLGDGLIWYLLMVAFPLALGMTGLALTAQMAFGGLIGLVTYKALKQRLIRERPFASYPSIHCAAAPLDRYSFPSGHTLHAVLFGTLILSAFPGLYPVMVPFVAMIALSRVILGLHYPSDVAVGAVIGIAIAKLTQVVLPLATFAPAA